MTLFTEHADVSVRPAVAEDAPRIAEIQLAAWQAALPTHLPAELLNAAQAGALADSWSAAITQSPSKLHRVMVACAGAEVVGFIAGQPAHATDESLGLDIIALEVFPAAQRAGHGSRLLTALVDVLRPQGITFVLTWVAAQLDAKAAFLQGAGFLRDDATRELQPLPGMERGLTEVRYSALLED